MGFPAAADYRAGRIVGEFDVVVDRSSDGLAPMAVAGSFEVECSKFCGSSDVPDFSGGVCSVYFQDVPVIER